MKKIVFVATLVALFQACNKENKANEPSELSPTDSLTLSAAEGNLPKILPLDEQSGTGKVVFSQDGKPVIVFDARELAGKIVIDGKEYPLTDLVFSENSYTIEGSGISITAEDGEFEEQLSECTSGMFPLVEVSLGEKIIKLQDVKVEDCQGF